MMFHILRNSFYYNWTKAWVLVILALARHFYEDRLAMHLIDPLELAKPKTQDRAMPSSPHRGLPLPVFRLRSQPLAVGRNFAAEMDSSHGLM